MKILLLGAGGMLGRAIEANLQTKAGVSLVLSHHKKNTEKDGDRVFVDLHVPSTVDKAFEKTQPDVCIHAAAISDPVACEKDPVVCKKINAEFLRYLVVLCKRYATKIVFFSTDYVFDGKSTIGYRENDITNPLQLYGLTKVKAEEYVTEYDNSLILRLAYLYGSEYKKTRNDFVFNTLEKLYKKETLLVDDVQMRFPTSTCDVAEVLWLLLQKNAKGLYHVSANEKITKYKWAKLIAEKAQISGDRIQRDTATFHSSTKPLNSHLLTTKLHKEIAFTFSFLEEITKKEVKAFLQ